MELVIKQGDILDECVDCLISTGNVHLNMSGGINGELLKRGGKHLQTQLHRFLRDHQLKHVEPGFCIKIGPDPFPYKCLIYAVAIDGFYDSSPELVTATLRNAFQIATTKQCQTIAVPALATGYGHLTVEEFAEGLKAAIHQKWSFSQIRVVVKNDEYVNTIKNLCNL